MVSFIKSANLVKQYYSDKRNQFCFIGRSNVGKSSLINALANQKIAKISSTPGRTKLINFFDFDSYILVDLPGYGYSKTSEQTSILLHTMIDEYLSWATKLVGIFQLCNIDVITDLDQQVSIYLQKIANKHHIEHFIVLTKLDKVNKSHFDNNKIKIAKYLNVNIDNIIPVSSKNKFNIDKLKKIINAINHRHI